MLSASERVKGDHRMGYRSRMRRGRRRRRRGRRRRRIR